LSQLETDRHAQLIADAHAIERLAAQPEWSTFTRILEEHIARVTLELRQRGLDHTTTEGLRAEIAALEWLRDRPKALKRAVEDYDAVATAAAAAQEAR
jgi:hypothetical protein